MAVTIFRYCKRCAGRLAVDQDSDVCSPCERARQSASRPPQKPAIFWERDDLRKALATHHFGKLVNAYRLAHQPPLKQTQVGLWLDMTQGQVSRLERGKAPSDLVKLARWAVALRVPADMLWFPIPKPEGESDSPDRAVSLALKPSVEGDDVHRRDLLKLAGAAAAATVGANLLRDSPWQRLTDSVSGNRPADPTTVRMMEDRTAEFFRTEETVPARQLYASIRSHLTELEALIESTRNEALQRRLMVAAGETQALAGWTLFDLQRPKAAIRAWQVAHKLADEAGDGPLAACVLGYWSYLLSADDEPEKAVRMLEDAASYVRGSAPATQAWIAGRQAEEYSAVGDANSALHALDRAMTVFDYANPRTERAWTPFFTASRLGSLTVSTYGRLDYWETDDAAASLLSSLAPTENKVRALVLADLATTAVQRGDLDRVGSLARQSAPLAVRTEASLAVNKLWDVVEKLPSEGREARSISDWLTGELVSGGSA